MSGPPPLPGGPRKGFPVAFIVFALALTPVIGLLIGYFSFRVSNAKALRALEERARQKGEPLTLAELAAKYPAIPDEENAAIPLLQLWEKEDPAFWQAFRQGERSLPTRATPDVAPQLPYLGGEARRVMRSEPLSQASREAAEAYVSEQ